MNPLFIDSCFTCGETNYQHSNTRQITRPRKCISIVISKARKFASIPRLLKIKSPLQVSKQEPRVQDKQTINLKATQENIKPQALYVQTKRLIINPQKQTQKNNDQPKISKIINNQSTHHRRSKSNYASPTYVTGLDHLRQKRSSFHNSGARNIINKLQNSTIFDKSIFLGKEPIILGLNIPIHQSKSQFSQKNNLGYQNQTFFTKISNAQFDLKQKKLLRKSKYCDVYLFRQSSTGTIYSLKEIFKQSTLLPFYYRSIWNDIVTISQIYHPNIICYYRYFQNKDKIMIIQQYSPSTLFEQLQIKKTLPLSLVKQYMKDVINAVVTLHENNKFHGNLSLHQIGCGFSTCKVRPSLTYMIGQQGDGRFIDDIHAIGLLGYQMAYGICCSQQNQEKSSYSGRSCSDRIKDKIVLDLLIKKDSELRESHRQLIFLIQELLNLNEEIQLSANMCFNHAFFRGLI